MIKTITTLTLVASTLLLTACGGFQNNIGRMGNALSTGNYTVTVWSGEKAVKVYQVTNGFVNTETDSDGWFFFVDGKLIRVSGTVTVEQQ